MLRNISNFKTPVLTKYFVKEYVLIILDLENFMENNSIKLNSSKFHQSLVECAFINNNSYRAFPTPTFIPINSKGPFLFCSQISSTPIFRQRYVKKGKNVFPQKPSVRKITYDRSGSVDLNEQITAPWNSKKLSIIVHYPTDY